MRIPMAVLLVVLGISSGLTAPSIADAPLSPENVELPINHIPDLEYSRPNNTPLYLDLVVPARRVR